MEAKRAAMAATSGSGPFGADAQAAALGQPAHAAAVSAVSAPVPGQSVWVGWGGGQVSIACQTHAQNNQALTSLARTFVGVVGNVAVRHCGGGGGGKRRRGKLGRRESKKENGTAAAGRLFYSSFRFHRPPPHRSVSHTAMSQKTWKSHNGKNHTRFRV